MRSPARTVLALCTCHPDAAVADVAAAVSIADQVPALSQLLAGGLGGLAQQPARAGTLYAACSTACP
jgi:hypothetical protein